METTPIKDYSRRGRIIRYAVLFGMLVLFVLILLFSSFYELNEDEFAVITQRFLLCSHSSLSYLYGGMHHI